MTPANGNILPDEPAAAVKALIDIVRKLRSLTEDESRALALGDQILLEAVNREKDELAIIYEQAAQEFRARAEDFRIVEKPLLEKLRQDQLALKELAEANIKIMPQA